MISVNSVESSSQFRNNIVAYCCNEIGRKFSFAGSPHIKFAYVTPPIQIFGKFYSYGARSFTLSSVSKDGYSDDYHLTDFQLDKEPLKMRFATFHEINEIQQAVLLGKVHDIPKDEDENYNLNWDKVKELALERFKVTSIPFIFGRTDTGSPISQLPQEVVVYILNS